VRAPGGDGYRFGEPARDGDFGRDARRDDEVETAIDLKSKREGGGQAESAGPVSGGDGYRFGEQARVQAIAARHNVEVETAIDLESKREGKLVRMIRPFSW